MPSRRGSRAGRRVQRSRPAQSPQHTADPCLAVQAALTDAACQRITDAFVAVNPAYAGVRVADVIDMLHDSDSYIALTDPYWDQHGEQLSRQLGDRWQVTGPAAVAAVLLSGLQDVCWPSLLEAASVTAAGAQLMASLPPADYTDLADRIARAAAAGARGVVDAPEPPGHARWLDSNGTVLARHPLSDELLLIASGPCDSCVHPAADHDPATGACSRINPTIGPCPCAHTPDQQRAAQQAAFARQHST